jgi:1-aminocyclopropane-1-carboxylate deaminase/D-cysteine desulfhydrase-like pyridoxal-dependent ACC family enzyme
MTASLTTICARWWTARPKVVFIHAGGAPALFAHRRLFD